MAMQEQQQQHNGTPLNVALSVQKPSKRH